MHRFAVRAAGIVIEPRRSALRATERPLTMFIRHMRPRFRQSVPIGPDRVIELLEQHLAQPDCPCRGAVAGNHRVVELNVLHRDRNFWSPSLSVTIGGDEDGTGSVVHGLVGPNPNLWTLFAMTYMGLLTLLMFVGIFGLIQWWLDLYPWGLFIVPVLLVSIGLMFAMSRIGQRLAKPQTAMLRQFLEDVLSASPDERADFDDDFRNTGAVSR